MFTYNLWMDCLHPDKLIMSIILSSYQHIAMSNNFKHSHVHFYTFFLLIKLDLFMQALLLDYILALE